MLNSWISEYGSNGVVLMDGGMGQELRRRSSNDPTSLWSAQALLEQPSLVQQVHEDYIRAGARVITTNSYATVRKRLQEISGLGDQFERLIALSGELAVSARDSVGEKVLIAGSLPPLNGSYRPDRVQHESHLNAVYSEHAERLAPYVDVLLCETMSTAAEARVAAHAAAATGKPVWVAWTLKDTGAPVLRSGETLQSAWQALAGIAVEAVMANCCSPASIAAAMPALAAMELPLFGGYANGFGDIPSDWTVQEQGVDALGHRSNSDPAGYAAQVQGWVTSGATLVGGCCEVTPAHIAAVAQQLGQTSP